MASRNKIKGLIEKWKKRNINGYFFENRQDALKEIVNNIPVSAGIGISGSVTLDQLGLVGILEKRGNKVYNQYKPGIDRQESLRLRKEGSRAEFYLASANAISENGELVFLSAWGNRTSGIAYADNVIIVCGINKICKDAAEAIKRSRDYAAPLNCKRLNWQSYCFNGKACNQELCLFPEYKRMCCQLLLVEAEIKPDRLKIFIINENLGF
ncbi:MAG: hypothetical protein C4533_05710 [Candidatus Omnitrophota bacterium]|jgi:hypothetical protein|nr:MAG: hypothetical protein C4533_05710 [Candidatus Omnitrophota bacterium]